VALILEFICGACNTLDEYTLYLSAQQLLGLELELSGKYVGIGIDVGVSEQKLFIIRVLRGSPAEQALLAPGDRILRIDGQSVDPLASAAAAARLLGEEGTSVELEVQPLGHPGSLPPPLRTIKLIRQAVYLSSVETFFEFKEEAKDHSGIGYIKLASFQKNTLHELKDALLQLQSQSLGLKVLVLDLRGNLGGYFPAARQVAELFLQEGVIVYTQTRHREEAHRANNPQALTLPLVLLVDGETASAAEVVAGAFKETGRATLVGQPTFGKGTIQCLVRLDTIKSGLQITIARFCSPNHISYDGRGVLPDRYVERTGMMGDGQREAAFQVADQMLKLVPR
jgi:carboxyl-terminal processing protease